MHILSASELASFESDIADHFDQFSSNHTLTIYKRPLEIIADVNVNTYAGYGQDPQNSSNISYQSISGSFPCLVINPNKDNKDASFESVPFFILNGRTVIKVKEDAKNFIENGIINEAFVLDTETFRKISSSSLKKYGASKYYYFELEQTS